MDILITGANGFIGSRVTDVAMKRGWQQRSQIRRASGIASDVIISSIDCNTDWSSALRGIDCVVHCAARVHKMKESQSDALAAYRAVNTQGTLNLARQAVSAGVKRFVFLSSIKVNGESTAVGQAFQSTVLSVPTDPYALSKYEAELGLQRIANDTGLEVVIIRPPLVYGEGVKANVLSMMHWVKKGIPLPFGAIHNRRSLVYRENLVSLILLCCEHERAAGHVFLVSDNDDISTSRLLKQVAIAMRKPFFMLPVPMAVIQGLGSVVGKSAMAARLCGNLQVDISHTMAHLDWQPPVSFEQGIQNTVTDFLVKNKR